MVKVKDISSKLFEGAYEYQQNGVTYCNENFVIFRGEENKTYVYRSEITSRVKTGEFLKINCDYEVDAKFNTVKVIVEKSLGEDVVTETFRVLGDTNKLEYCFSTNDEEEFAEKNLPNKFSITTPAFLTSMLFTQTKKFSSMGRNQYNILTPQSDWQFNPEIIDNSLFLEFKSHEKSEITVNKQTLSCMKILLFKHDTIENVPEKPIVVYLSKHLGVPYMMETVDGTVIKIKNLKKNEDQYAGMF